MNITWVTSPKGDKTFIFIVFVSKCSTVYLNFPSFVAGARGLQRRMEIGRVFFKTGFQAGDQSQKAKTLIVYIFGLFPSYIWPLAGPNIAKKDGPLRELARGGSANPFWDF